MSTSSEYTFPIFISSTVYNLIDLRGELAKFLSELGYKPILSSEAGFPDKTPDYEPWESCLEVLKHSFIMLLIIDGKYGTTLKWDNYKDVFQGRKVSATHGEYIYAHNIKKRILVFIREEVLTCYETYRKLKDEGKSETEIKSSFPKYIAFETLKFVEEVKTTSPIPWIVPFKDVTAIKTEVQKKLFNELVEKFMVQNRNLESVIDAFNKVMSNLGPEKRDEVLKSLPVTKDLMIVPEALKQKEDELLRLEEELKVAKSTQTEESEKIKLLKEQIELLKERLKIYEKDTDKVYIQKGELKFGGSAIYDSFLKISKDTLTEVLTRIA